MSFTAPKFTNAGKWLQARALTGAPLTFTKIQMGDGELVGGAIPAMTALTHPVVTVDVSSVRRTDNTATIKGVFSNAGLTAGFYWREIGLFAADPDHADDREKDILYCYQNAGDLAEYIPAAASEVIEKVLSIGAVVGDAEHVTALLASNVYVLTEDFEAHVNDKANPHGVTPQGIGAALAQHTHGTGDVNGLDAALKGKVSKTVVTYVDANKLLDEGRYFLINNPDTPYAHGFLEVRYYDGGGFAPTGGLWGVTKCIRQTFRSYEKQSVYERYALIKTVLSADAEWSEWKQLADTTTLNTALADKADKVHTHTTAQVDGLDAALKSYLKLTNKTDINNPPDFNSLTSGTCTDAVFGSTTDQSSYHTPLGEAGTKGDTWYTVFTLGVAGSRISQIALLPYSHNRKMYVRFKHDSNWSPWKRVVAEEDLSSYLPKTGGTMSGGVAMKNLMLTDYGTPFECSAYIDFHAAGSNVDFSGRLHVGADGVLNYYGTNSGQVVTSGNLSALLAACGTPNNTWVPIGDDCYIGDHNVAGYLCVKQKTGSKPGIKLYNSDESASYEVIHTGNAATLLKSQMPGLQLLQDITITQEGLTQIAIQIPSSYWSDWKTIRFVMNLNNAVTVRLEDQENIILSLRMESWRIDFQPHYDPSFWVVTDYQSTLGNGTVVSPKYKFQDIHTIYLAFLKVNAGYTTMQLGTRIRIYGEK